ncbi:MAG: DUF695 domain-containing protein [Saprospiraceae bacterium]|nr:DUF695 domain-containing protein [Saprospiraceae bacterium]
MNNIEIKDNWDFYFVNIDNIYSSIYLNLDYFNKGKYLNKGNLVVLHLYIRTPQKNGMPSNEESKTLFEIEDKLESSLTEQYDSSFVGRLTTYGRRDFYFYQSNREGVDTLIDTIMTSFPEYEYEFSEREDSNWDIYHGFLYPSNRDLQIIQNRRIVSVLEEKGDTLLKEREVYHWSYFQSNKDKENFIKKLIDEGYKLIKEQRNDDWGKFCYQVQVSRSNLINYNVVDEAILPVWECTVENQGYYDGWETSIEK